MKHKTEIFIAYNRVHL